MSGIRVEGLGKRFGGHVAVEGLSFEVHPGEVFGLLGPNGAGKTTTVRMLSGLLTPTSGRAEVAGEPLDGNAEKLRAKVGLLTEQPGLYDRLSARENLRFFAKLHLLEEDVADRRAAALLSRLGLAGREHEPCGSFSKGMRQKLALVRTLLHQPEVLFLDEPTSGLDPEAARSVRDLIAELAAEGRTVVLCSHNLAEVERLCARVAVIKRTMRTLSNVQALRREGMAVDLRLEGDAQRFIPTLTALPFSAQALAEGDRLRVLLSDEAHVPDVVSSLVHAGARIHRAERTVRPLEEVYLELVREETKAEERR